MRLGFKLRAALAVATLAALAACTTANSFGPSVVTVNSALLNPVPGTFFGNGMTVAVSSVPGDGDVRYTTDGSDPVASSPLYTNGIVVTNQMNTVVKVRRVSSSGYGPLSTGRYVMLNTVQQINLGWGGHWISGLGVNADGSLLYVGLTNGRILRVMNPSSGAPAISNVAGSGVPGNDGDTAGPPGCASAKKVFFPGMMHVAANGDVYFPEYDGVSYATAGAGNRIRKIAGDGSSLVTLAGNGTPASVNGTGASASIFRPIALVRDPASGDLIIAETDGDNAGKGNRLRRMTLAGAVSFFSGSGLRGDAGGAASSAAFSCMFGLAAAPDGTLFVSDPGYDGVNYFTIGKIKRVRSDGSVGPYVGALSGGAGTPVSTANLGRIDGLAVDHGGNVLIAWNPSNQIMKLSPDGSFSVLAGFPISQAGSASGSMQSACLNAPTVVVVSPNGEVFAGCQDGTGWVRRFYYLAP